ncbi:MAG: branched-chain amino acid ABC transporter substrate-binding protein, partial [Proteobacteria bacterium]|nr:branched-chain amino acid ABC transporter substrate-binding protein [Pseudomonadota bacterium]NIS69239.1 branched-chain amino acid ABC transporter substrate-binding protein [Pseudomonadota bacterium]
MRKGILLVICVLVIGLAFSPLVWGAAKTIKIGINAPITGDIPKVGEGTKFAAQMWLEDINAAGGLEVG